MDNLNFKELNKFENWLSGKSSISFQYESIRVPYTIIDTIDTEDTDDPSWSFFQRYFMNTSASTGSIETPWFGKPFVEETFLPSFKARQAFFSFKVYSIFLI